MKTVDERVKELEEKWKEVDKVLDPVVARPAGVFTTAEYAEHKGISPDVARHWLNKSDTIVRIKIGGKVYYRVKGSK